MRFLLTTLLILGVIGCIPYSAKAQIVNIETKRIKFDADTSGWFGSIDFGMNLTQNGQRVFHFNGNADLKYLQGKNLWLALTNYQFLNAGKQSFLNSGFQHLRYNRQLKKKLTWEVFTQAQYNEQLRIRFRGLLGTGPRFQLFEKEKGQIFLGTLYMFQYEELNNIAIIHRDHRLSAYLRIGLNFSDKVNIYSTSYYQPLLTNPKIVRLSSQTSMNVKISSHLSFSSTFNISIDNRLSDEAGVPTTNYGFVNGLKWRF